MKKNKRNTKLALKGMNKNALKENNNNNNKIKKEVNILKKEKKK